MIFHKDTNELKVQGQQIRVGREMFHLSTCALLLLTLRTIPEAPAKFFLYHHHSFISPIQQTVLPVLCIAPFFPLLLTLPTQLECQVKTSVQIFHPHFCSLLENLKENSGGPPSLHPHISLCFEGCGSLALWQLELLVRKAAPSPRSLLAPEFQVFSRLPGVFLVVKHDGTQ